MADLIVALRGECVRSTESIFPGLLTIGDFFSNESSGTKLESPVLFAESVCARDGSESKKKQSVKKKNIL